MISGTISYVPDLPTDAGGGRLVEATSALDAVRQTFTGSVQVAFGGNTYTYTPSGQAIGATTADHRDFWFDGNTLWLEDMANPGRLDEVSQSPGPGGSGGTGGGSVCDWDYNDHKWFVEVQEVASNYPVPGDLDILDSNGDEVAEDKETAVGGWVPLNNDNDNYNFASSNSLTQVYDYSDTSKTDGENDLVPLKITLGEPAGSYYFIDLSQASGLRFWTTADKETQYTGSTIDLTGKQSLTIWAEGNVTSSTPRANLLQLKFRGTNQAIYTVDQVRLTVYRVEGAMNVPGYSKHTYAAEVPGGTPRFVAGNMATNVTEGNSVANPNLPITTVTAQVRGGPARRWACTASTPLPTTTSGSTDR